MIVDLTASTLIVAGLAFYTAGTVGLLRFPDQRSRVHALSKADNLAWASSWQGRRSPGAIRASR